MNKTKEEIYYWNFIKTIAICLVVYCHLPLLNPSWYNNYSQLLTFIAVPLFFMVNGAALFSCSTLSFIWGIVLRKKVCEKRCRTVFLRLYQ